MAAICLAATAAYSCGGGDDDDDAASTADDDTASTDDDIDDDDASDDDSTSDDDTADDDTTDDDDVSLIADDFEDDTPGAPPGAPWTAKEFVDGRAEVLALASAEAGGNVLSLFSPNGASGAQAAASLAVSEQTRRITLTWVMRTAMKGSAIIELTNTMGTPTVTDDVTVYAFGFNDLLNETQLGILDPSGDVTQLIPCVQAKESTWFEVRVELHLLEAVSQTFVDDELCSSVDDVDFFNDITPDRLGFYSFGEDADQLVDDITVELSDKI
ncbi:hypothetical protein KDL45_08450 [bacterium]|nr:hypothetical protein [bacterium]